MTRSVLRIGVMELRRRPGTQREVDLATHLPGLSITSAGVPESAEVRVRGVLEAIEGAITISGRVAAPWVGDCRRCLEPVQGEVDAVLSEVFEVSPVEGETYPIEGDEVDLERVVRDAVLLSLPLAPLCRADCAGPAPDTFPTVVGGDDEPGADDDAERPPDPRWAALEGLTFEGD